MDIVKFLQSVEWMCHSKARGLMENERPYEAATEIERLRRKIHALQEALKYIADMPDGWEEDEELNMMFIIDNHVKAASEALGEKE